MEAIREFLPFLGPMTAIIMYVFLLVTVLVIGYGIKKRLDRYGISLRGIGAAFGKAWQEHGRARLQAVVSFGLLQRKLVRRPYAGVFHWCIYGSMLLLTLGTILVAFQQDVLARFSMAPILYNGSYFAFEAIMDTGAGLLVLGLLLAAGRRLFAKPAELENTAEAFSVLALLLFIALSGLVIEGMRLYLKPVSWAGYSYLGNLLAAGFSAMGLERAALQSAYGVLWWVHVGAAFGFLALLPFTKLYHILAIPVHLFFLDPIRPKSKLSLPFKLEDMAEEDENAPEPTIGIRTIGELDWNRRLALDACVNCGRCESVCPANAAGRMLSPRRLIQGLAGEQRREMPLVQLSHPAAAAASDAPAESLFTQGVVTKEVTWSCTNCSACMEECPAGIQHVEFVLDLRRHLLAEGDMDEKQAALLEAVERNGNPYGLPSYSRNEWLIEKGVPTLDENPDADIVYWIGCAGAYDSRAQQTILAVIRLLQAAHVSFAILAEEKCCGEAVKRLGEEGRFQLLAMENISMLEMYADKTFLTSCPHCYNTLKYEYHDFGLELKVMHHTELLAKLLAEGRLSLAAGAPCRMVYHDPCNLGRLNGIYDAPRTVLRAVPGLTLAEAARTRDKSFCCGAGGGNAWYNVPEKEKISSLRLRELQAAGAPETVVVACPYCLSMFEDAVKTEGMEEKLQIRDIAEVLAKHLSI